MSFPRVKKPTRACPSVRPFVRLQHSTLLTMECICNDRELADTLEELAGGVEESLVRIQTMR